MSMFTVTGILVHIFKTPEGRNAEGEVFGGDHKIQVMGEIPLPNGETRHEMIDLKVHDAAIYKDLVGQRMTVQIGTMALAKNKMVYFIPKGSQPAKAA